MSIVQDSPALPNGWNAIDVLGTPVFIKCVCGGPLRIRPAH